MNETEKPIYIKDNINLTTFLKTDFGKKVKEVHNCLNDVIMKNPYEYLETGAIEEAVRIFKYYTKRQKPQLQEDYHQ
jgi:hypothetical protein